MKVIFSLTGNNGEHREHNLDTLDLIKFSFGLDNTTLENEKKKEEY
jgi:hypothetical protein